MSIENVKQFYQLAVTDQELRQELTRLSEQAGVQAIDKSKAESMIEQLVIPIATQRGLPFTIDDLQQYNQELKKAQASGELSAEELDSVAGGVGVGGGACFFIGLAGAIDIGDAFCFFIGI